VTSRCRWQNVIKMELKSGLRVSTEQIWTNMLSGGVGFPMNTVVNLQLKSMTNFLNMWATIRFSKKFNSLLEDSPGIVTACVFVGQQQHWEVSSYFTALYAYFYNTFITFEVFTATERSTVILAVNLVNTEWISNVGNWPSPSMK
jgi:hypothetical protein